jgi:hypothetical protein
MTHIDWLHYNKTQFYMMSNILYILSETQVDDLIEYVCRNYGNSNGKESDNKVGPAQQQVIILLPFALAFFAPSFNCLPASLRIRDACPIVSAAMDLVHCAH